MPQTSPRAEPKVMTVDAPGRGAQGETPRAGWTFTRLLIVLGAASILVAIGFHTQLDPKALADPFIWALFAPGLLFTIVLLFKDKPWVQLVAGITLLFLPLVVLVVFGGYSDLVNPLRGPDATSILFLLLSILLAFPAGIRGFRAGRTGRAAAGARTGWRTGHGLFATVAIAAIVGAAFTGTLAFRQASGSGFGGGYDFTPEISVAVGTVDFAFEPKQLTIASGALTEIVVTNSDPALHTFTYELDGTEYSHDVPGNGEARFLVLFESAGTIPFRCVPHSSGYEDDGENMVGSIVVT